MAKDQLLLSIIIVSYNTAKLSVQTLESVYNSLQLAKDLAKKTEIFVVDNDSSDDSVKKIGEISKKFDHFHLIENKKNVGFASANNQAANLARGEYLLLLNSDTVVIGNALEILLSSAIKNKLDIAASTLLNQDLSVQPQGGSLPSLYAVTMQMLFLDDLPLVGGHLTSTQKTGHNFGGSAKKTDTITPMGWVGGTAMLIRKSTWEEIGPLDEDIFMYGEDMELSLRAYKRGKKIAIVDNAHIIHLGSASSSSKNAIIGELTGYIHIWRKHKPSWQMPILRIILKIGVLLRVLLFALLDKNRFNIYLQALKTV